MCNEIDDDCNGSTADGSDEAWLGSSCDGNDSDLCEESVYTCSGGVQTCSDNTSSNVEICNNLDDNCDGEVDEGCVECYPDLAPPDLEFTGTQRISDSITIYYLSVTNRAQYPAQLFVQSSDYPLCYPDLGSRSVVEIYDGNDDLLIDYCDFSSPDDLESFYFPIDYPSSPPAAVYIRIVDRAWCDQTYLSNMVQITSIDVTGYWSVQYDWGCTGNLAPGSFDFFSDGTFTDVDGEPGTWSLNGSQITITYTMGTIYTGTVSGDEMEGTMVSSGGSTGCWSATKGGDSLSFEDSISINSGESSANPAGNQRSP